MGSGSYSSSSYRIPLTSFPAWARTRRRVWCGCVSPDRRDGSLVGHGALAVSSCHRGNVNVRATAEAPTGAAGEYNRRARFESKIEIPARARAWYSDSTGCRGPLRAFELRAAPWLLAWLSFCPSPPLRPLPSARPTNRLVPAAEAIASAAARDHMPNRRRARRLLTDNAPTIVARRRLVTRPQTASFGRLAGK